MGLLSTVFLQTTNKVACQKHAIVLTEKAKRILPPEGEILAKLVMAAYFILEELVAPTKPKQRIVSQKLKTLTEDKIAELYAATTWTLVAMLASQQRESDDDWITLCTDLVGPVDLSSEFFTTIWGGLEEGAFPSAIIALRSKYLEILNAPKNMDTGWIPLQLITLAAYQAAIHEHYGHS